MNKRVSYQSFNNEMNDLKARMLMRAPQKMYIVFGARNVGKSTLISRFLIDYIFPDKRDFNNEGIRKMMMYSTKINIRYKNIRVEVEVLDTQSYDPYFTFLPTKHGIGISGYIVMFDPSRADTVESVQLIYEKLFQINGRNKPLVIVGNINSEMKLNNSIDESYWSHDEDIKEFSDLNKIPYIKLDVKNCTEKEINSVFSTLVMESLREEIKSKDVVPFIKQRLSIIFLITLAFQLIFGFMVIFYATMLTEKAPQSLYHTEGAFLLFILLCVGILYTVGAALAFQSLRRVSREIFCAVKQSFINQFQMIVILCCCLSTLGLALVFDPVNGLFDANNGVMSWATQTQLKIILTGSIFVSVSQFIFSLFMSKKISSHIKK